MQLSGSIAKKLGPSKNASTGHTATQSVYMHLMQLSSTMNAIKIIIYNSRWRIIFKLQYKSVNLPCVSKIFIRLFVSVPVKCETVFYTSL